MRQGIDNMTDNHSGNSVTDDSVYRAHRDKILSEDRNNNPVTHTDSYNYHPDKESDGTVLEQIIEYAHLEIPAEDSAPTRCATFDALDYICGIIAAKERIKRTRIYPALRMIGYNWRYHDMKNGNPDALYGMGERVQTCMISADPGLVSYVSHSKGLFTGTRSVQYRMIRESMGIAMDDADDAGVTLSELNLFNALEGLTRLVENSTTYRDLRDNLFFDETLTMFSFIKRRLIAKRDTIERIVWG